MSDVCDGSKRKRLFDNDWLVEIAWVTQMPNESKLVNYCGGLDPLLSRSLSLEDSTSAPNEKDSHVFRLFLLSSLQQWCDELVKLAYNLTQLNGSATMFLQKAHVKLSLQVDKTGKIPVKK